MGFYTIGVPSETLCHPVRTQIQNRHKGGVFPTAADALQCVNPLREPAYFTRPIGFFLKKYADAL